MGIGEEAATPTAAEATTAAAGASAGSEATTAGEGRQGRPQPACGLERAEETLTPRQSLTISLLRNIRYHEDREAFLTLLNRLMNLAVLLSGTGVVASLTTTHDDWSKGIAIGTAAIGAIQLVFDPSRRQFQHEGLRVRFLDLLSELKDDNVAAISGSAAKLYPQEPPTYFAVDALAFNAAQKALNRPPSTFKVVTAGQRWFANWRRFTDVDFKEAGPGVGRE